LTKRGQKNFPKVLICAPLTAHRMLPFFRATENIKSVRKSDGDPVLSAT
jgi:hypothetical protein